MCLPKLTFKTSGVKNLFLYTIMVLLIYPAIQTPAEFLLHLKCLLHKLQGLELLLTRCRRTPCFTAIRPQQLTTSFMHDRNDYGCERYWYWYRYWYPILTLLLASLETKSNKSILSVCVLKLRHEFLVKGS